MTKEKRLASSSSSSPPEGVSAGKIQGSVRCQIGTENTVSRNVTWNVTHPKFQEPAPQPKAATADPKPHPPEKPLQITSSEDLQQWLDQTQWSSKNNRFRFEGGQLLNLRNRKRSKLVFKDNKKFTVYWAVGGVQRFTFDDDYQRFTGPNGYGGTSIYTLIQDRPDSDSVDPDPNRPSIFNLPPDLRKDD